MQNQSDKKKKIILILLILVLAAMAIAGVMIAYYAGKSDNSSRSKGIVISEEATEWDKELENLSGEQTGIKIPGYGEITVSAKEKTWNITLANPKDNNCYFQYEIVIDGQDAPIYTSDFIEPGKAIREFQVSKSLETGDYIVYFNISTYSMDGEYSRLNGASVKATLHVI